MPELPEVESSRKFVEQLCAGHVIHKLSIREQGGGPRDGLFDDLIFEDGKDPANEGVFYKALHQRTLKSVHRKGKQMWFEFADGGDSVLFHFGMTGSFAMKDHPIPMYKSFKVDADNWPPRFAKAVLEFSNGVELAFCDPRRLGRIKIRADPLGSPPLSKLGIDPVTGTIPSPAELSQLLSSISAPIKAVLLDQERLFCGIGNYLADEICYQAGIHPATKANGINEVGLASMVDAMAYIFKTAVEADARYDLFPKHWLFHYRWDKSKSKKENVHMPDGSRITFEEVGGRTTAIVSSKQPRSGSFTGEVKAETASSSSSSSSAPSKKAGKKVAVVKVEAVEQPVEVKEERGQKAQKGADKKRKVKVADELSAQIAPVEVCAVSVGNTSSSRKRIKAAPAVDVPAAGPSGRATRTRVGGSKGK
ncbi:Formamidopyrimidine-DNA glycosylase N-terminal domain-containing protein [Ochromonadaceae sp. CCMP2298]|nr:Formamidopyrimidine-DNA glycosylase N-terminal domain-containing protein [Ochromonadaceae sp. CCMP2298]|mmetsp:Transcript_33312/g.73399  ORF Transcript_33312/g.73399 Transcript_33312/m.73399 type:complete len:421 (+) Transcript_33312:260-1522(+)|eukprot:CAMPEP_0173198832 /NCGR_PEP_ID=MMETSP1141-20130122/16902_1 /TAXON_ID=483371 /ORGANISM="non described non described, Strain CCMP2298" /LENGTH=420 /DNA_ID=CAMNT_0014123661 /DNA_START=167 /DNA_END=1429 /DNA_ORIENTATION=-